MKLIRESISNIKGIAGVFMLAMVCLLCGGISEKVYAEEKVIKLEAVDDTGKYKEITDSTKFDGFKYDSKTYTIELNNYDSTKTGYGYFKFSCDPKAAAIPTLTVKVSGKNVLHGDKYAGIYSAGYLIITGDGSLDIKDVDGDLNSIEGIEVTIDGPTINISGKNDKYKTPIYCSKSVTIKSAKITFENVLNGINGRQYLEITDSEINVTQTQEEFDAYASNDILSGDQVFINNSIINMEVDCKLNYNGIKAYGSIEINDSKLYIKAIPKVNNDNEVIYPEVLFASYIRMNNVDISIEIGEYEKNEYSKIGDIRLMGTNTEFTLKDVNVVVIGDKDILELLEDVQKHKSSESMYTVFDVYRDITTTNVEVRKFESTDVSKLEVNLEKDSLLDYTGEPVKPKVELKGLKEGKDYVVAYENNDRFGVAYVIIKGIGQFNGTIRIPYVITGVKKVDGPTVGTKITDGTFVYKVLKQSQRVIECKNVDGKAVITESNELYPGSVSVTKLNKKSLKKININSYVIIDGFKYKVTEIGKKAFKNNKKIKQVNIKSEFLENIGAYAFANCKNLKKVNINSKAFKKIGKKAFYKKTKKGKNVKKVKKVVVYIKKYGKKNWKKVFKKAKCNNFKLRIKK